MHSPVGRGLPYFPDRGWPFDLDGTSPSIESQYGEGWLILMFQGPD